MALVDDAVLTAAKGYIFTAEQDTPAPTPQEVFDFVDGTSLTGWDNLGHTARDELPEFGFDGGDTEPRGTWQNEALKTVTTDPAVDYVTFTAHQMDPETLALFYGQANSSSDENVYSVASSPGASTRKALLIVIVDGDTKVAFYAPRTDIRREEAATMAVDEFATLPMRSTFLGGGEVLFSWITGAESPEV